MDWLELHPDDLIERFEPAEALALLRTQSALTPAQMAKLDVYLHHWTLVLLQRGSDPEGVQELLTLCEIARDLAPDGTEGSAMQQRWGGLEDLLEGKRRYQQAGRIAAPVPLKHQDAILRIIQQANGGRAKQQDLAEPLKLSKGRVSQILGVLESRALITRQRRGKDCWVSLAHAGSAPQSPVRGKPPAAAVEHLGAAVFSYRKAA